MFRVGALTESEAQVAKGGGCPGVDRGRGVARKPREPEMGAPETLAVGWAGGAPGALWEDDFPK